MATRESLSEDNSMREPTDFEDLGVAFASLASAIRPQVIISNSLRPIYSGPECPSLES